MESTKCVLNSRFPCTYSILPFRKHLLGILLGTEDTTVNKALFPKEPLLLGMMERTGKPTAVILGKRYSKQRQQSNGRTSSNRWGRGSLAVQGHTDVGVLGTS